MEGTAPVMIQSVFRERYIYLHRLAAAAAPPAQFYLVYWCIQSAVCCGSLTGHHQPRKQLEHI